MATVKTFIGNIKGKDGINGEQFTTYSTEEKVVGQWIDGKPVYRKVVLTASAITLARDNWVSLGISLSNVIPINGYVPAENKTSSTYPIQWYVNNGIVTAMCFRSSQTMGKNAPIVLEYTKTTDAATV